MKISTRGRYGIKAMIDLAKNAKDSCISLKSIAVRQEISEHYLEQLIALLKKEKLVKSVRGAQGGYMLAKDAKDISVGDILRALEGSLAPVDCVVEDNPYKCEDSTKCVTRFIWEEVRDSINQVVDSITLKDLEEKN
jgi:Rrf2 family protein